MGKFATSCALNIECKMTERLSLIRISVAGFLFDAIVARLSTAIAQEPPEREAESPRPAKHCILW